MNPLSKLFKKERFTTGFKSWEVAKAASTGYSHAVDVLAKKFSPDNEANFTRSQQVLCAMLLAAHIYPQKHFTIIDFGGGLGQYYFDIRRHVPSSTHMLWRVVETPEMVAAANKLFLPSLAKPGDSLTFATAMPSTNVFISIASGSLQYVERPEDTFHQLSNISMFVVLNRMPMIGSMDDMLTVQNEDFISSSFPHWFLSRDKWERIFDRNHKMLSHWDCPLDRITFNGADLVHHGYLLGRKRI